MKCTVRCRTDRESSSLLGLPSRKEVRDGRVERALLGRTTIDLDHRDAHSDIIRGTSLNKLQTDIICDRAEQLVGSPEQLV